MDPPFPYTTLFGSVRSDDAPMAPEQMDRLRGVSAAQIRAIELAGDRIATKLTAAQKMGARPSAASRFRPEAAGLLHARPDRGYLRALRGELSQHLASGRGPT